MTQEEYVNFCNNKLTVRLTDVIEYLYKFLIDKNIQIKLLSEENNYLNAENLNLNKLNLELQEQCEKISKNTVKDDNSTFVNIDNNITNNNININMMMDYMKEVKQSMTSSEFRDGMIIDQFEINSELIFLVLKIVLLIVKEKMLIIKIKTKNQKKSLFLLIFKNIIIMI